jgi:hypothetical protein
MALAGQVWWYLDAGVPAANEQFATQNASAFTGALLCCGLASVAADGSVSLKFPAATVLNQTSALSRLGVPSLLVIGIADGAITSGAWSVSVVPLVQFAHASGSVGLVVDYEPVSNYTLQHAEAYAAFLQSLALALHADGLQLGFDCADWGILDFWTAFLGKGIDIFVSMSPTYSGKDVAADRQFVQNMITAGVSTDSISIGLGTMLKPSCTGYDNYDWTQATLAPFLDFLQSSSVHSISFWRSDIDDYCGTAPWMVDLAASFVADHSATL